MRELRLLLADPLLGALALGDLGAQVLDRAGQLPRALVDAPLELVARSRSASSARTRSEMSTAKTMTPTISPCSSR